MFDSLFVLTFLRMCIAFLIHSLLSCVLKFVLWGLYPPKAHYLLDLTWRAAMPLLFHSLPGQGGFVPRAKFQGFASKTRDLNLKIHLYIYIHYQTWCRALPYFTHFKPFNIRSRAVQVVCISEHGYPCLVTFFFFPAWSRSGTDAVGNMQIGSFERFKCDSIRVFIAIITVWI